MFTITRALTVCGLASVAAVSWAGTSTISHTVQMPEVEEFLFIDEGSGGDGVSIPITGVPKFDPALGTLVDVRIEFNFEFAYDLYLESEGILNPGVPHFATFQADQLALGVTFFRTVVDPPQFALRGIIEPTGVGCQGNPGDGDACFGDAFDSISAFFPMDTVADSILLDDFVGPGFYDGFFFEFDVFVVNFMLDNVATAFVEVFGSLDTFESTFTIEYEYMDASVDTDGDGVSDDQDNCTLVANPSQLDGDGDGYGNFCDADSNNDCVVNALDLGQLRSAFFSNDPVLDYNGDGVVNALDLGVLRVGFFMPPGPSGLTDVCTPAQSRGDATPEQIFDAKQRRFH